MELQVRGRFHREHGDLFRAVSVVYFIILLGLLVLVPQRYTHAADIDLRAMDGMRQFDVLAFELKDVEEKIPGVEGVWVRIRSNLAVFETSTNPSVKRMRNFVAEMRGRKLPPEELLVEVNRAVNERIKYVGDWDGFGASDYWAAPFEVVERLQGDCEDYAILKIVLLHLAGWNKEDLGILAGNLETAQGAVGHAVAFTRWFADGAYHYGVLDNLTNTVYGPREHPAFTPLYIVFPRYAKTLLQRNPGQKDEPAAGSLLEKIKSREEEDSN